MNTIPDCNVNKPRKSLIETLITGNLGYCCLWAFFKRNKSTYMIALRLGVSARAIRQYKARYKAGEYKCECKERCLKSLLTSPSVEPPDVA
jgi:hypothetical protein